ncbi:NAD(P)/FAD-dependent oxidoreductase [Tessaracoccus defluvii]|uniref:FAD-dependent oxidoreductase n=1 Tax=Tessaracoccus defluvii TaxID=1285901 RepID=A0A7H0H2D5_9ACTN|nr:FAD-dependent oxidoreductase [Tessaracoccus defluvii]QNP54701.1 FAD-dependent oxidoreductase [Tessaracoccus defluvii]
MSTYVIVGGGLAGTRTAEELRDLDGDARIVLVAGEAALPYDRPPLTKDYLLGAKQENDIVLHDAGWFTDNQIELHAGQNASSIDPAAQLVYLTDGTSIHYDGLALATGSRPRSLTVPGVGRPGVQTLRTLPESTQLRDSLAAGDPIVIVGGGWIGLEAAAAARHHGAPVTVLVRDRTVLPALGHEIGKRFIELHRKHGVEFVFGGELASIDGDGDRGPVTGVTLVGGRVIEARRVLIAVGAEPRVELAREAGLEVGNGVLVDDTLATSDPRIVAVGDIAAPENAWFGGRLRVEHWATALTQPAIAARTLVGDEAHFDGPPFFYTDQYDLSMEFRGVIPDEATMIQRGSGAEYLVIWLNRDGVPRAAMNVNQWEGDSLEALLRQARPADPRRFADPTVGLDEVTR